MVEGRELFRICPRENTESVREFRNASGWVLKVEGKQRREGSAQKILAHKNNGIQPRWVEILKEDGT